MRQKKSCSSCPAFTTSLFCDLSAEDMEKIDCGKTLRTYSPKEVLFVQGAVPEGIYCIRDGRVRVLHRSGKKKAQVVSIQGGGTTLGLAEFILQQNHSVSAEATEPTTVCFIGRAALGGVLARSEVLSRQASRKLAGQLTQDLNTFCGHFQSTVRERVAKVLLMLGESIGQREGKGPGPVLLRVTRGAIASLAGTVLESAVRCLSEFKRDGIISISGRQITLLDQTRLRSLQAS